MKQAGSKARTLRRTTVNKVPRRGGHAPVPQLGVYRARILGSLSRREIYDERPAQKIERMAEEIAKLNPKEERTLAEENVAVEARRAGARWR